MSPLTSIIVLIIINALLIVAVPTWIGYAYAAKNMLQTLLSAAIELILLVAVIIIFIIAAQSSDAFAAPVPILMYVCAVIFTAWGFLLVGEHLAEISWRKPAKRYRK